MLCLVREVFPVRFIFCFGLQIFFSPNLRKIYGDKNFLSSWFTSLISSAIFKAFFFAKLFKKRSDDNKNFLAL